MPADLGLEVMQAGGRGKPQSGIQGIKECYMFVPVADMAFPNATIFMMIGCA